MSLVERLGYKTLDEFYQDYDNNMIMEWLAYDMTQNTEWKEKANAEKAMEVQKERTPEQEAEAMKQFFMGVR